MLFQLKVERWDLTVAREGNVYSVSSGAITKLATVSVEQLSIWFALNLTGVEAVHLDGVALVDVELLAEVRDSVVQVCFKEGVLTSLYMTSLFPLGVPTVRLEMITKAKVGTAHLELEKEVEGRHIEYHLHADLRSTVTEVTAEAECLGLDTLELEFESLCVALPGPDEVSECDRWSDDTEICPSGEVRVWTPQFPDGFIQLHDLPLGIVDLPLHMGTEVEVRVEVDSEVPCLGLPLELDPIQDELGGVMHLEPTPMKQRRPLVPRLYAMSASLGRGGT